MFAKVNEPVRVEDLLRGIVIQSGNDAAIAVAEGICGHRGEFRTADDRTGTPDRPDEIHLP